MTEAASDGTVAGSRDPVTVFLARGAANLIGLAYVAAGQGRRDDAVARATIADGAE